MKSAARRVRAELPGPGRAGPRRGCPQPPPRRASPRLLALRQRRATPPLRGSGTGRPEGKCAAGSGGWGSGLAGLGRRRRGGGCGGRRPPRSAGSGGGGGRSSPRSGRRGDGRSPPRLARSRGLGPPPPPRLGEERDRPVRPAPAAVCVFPPARGSPFRGSEAAGRCQTLPSRRGPGGRASRGGRAGYPGPAAGPGPAVCVRVPRARRAPRREVRGR